MALIGKGKVTGNTESSSVAHRGGDAQISLGGTFSSATATVWTSQDNGTTYFPIVDSARTVPDQFILELVNECLIKIVVSGGGSPVIDFAISVDQSEDQSN